MNRRSTFAVTLLAIVALVAAACVPPPPPGRDWRVKAESITVHVGEDKDGGDEPYVIQIGFRSKLGVEGSTSTSIKSQCRAGKIPGYNAVKDGMTYMIPAGAADILFPGVQNLDIVDLLAETAPFEVIGTLAFVVERDAITGGCAITDAVDYGLRPVLKDALELLIAKSPVPPTQEELLDLLVDNLGNFVNAIGSLIGAVLEGFGNPDDVLGVAAQIHLPTIGSLTELVKTAFAIGGLFSPGLEQGFIPIEDLPSEIQIRVGTLSASSATFRFTTPGYDYSYKSTVSTL
jgi:hypothetical protein